MFEVSLSNYGYFKDKKFCSDIWLIKWNVIIAFVSKIVGAFFFAKLSFTAGSCFTLVLFSSETPCNVKTLTVFSVWSDVEALLIVLF